jgi:hypothetical protein
MLCRALPISSTDLNSSSKRDGSTQSLKEGKWSNLGLSGSKKLQMKGVFNYFQLKLERKK